MPGERDVLLASPVLPFRRHLLASLTLCCRRRPGVVGAVGGRRWRGGVQLGGRWLR